MFVKVKNVETTVLINKILNMLQIIYKPNIDINNFLLNYSFLKNLFASKAPRI